MQKPKTPPTVQELQALPVDMVGDGKTPDVFFVSQQGIIVLITTEYELAHSYWAAISRNRDVETALENRTFGVIASVGPEDDEDDAKLVLTDDDFLYKRYGR